MFNKDIPVEQLLFGDHEYIAIDVRSPSEFHDATIPGAINIPLFNDEERAQVGTTYKLQGQNDAKWLGMNIVSPKLPTLLSQIKVETSTGKIPVVFCWRGGMRSMSIATFAHFSGLNVFRLSGGYRAYRRYVVEHLTPSLLPEKTFTLHGMTGVGKTLILHQLKRWNEPVLDLEGIAGHRGSVFGSIGTLEKNQKSFDALLFDTLTSFKKAKQNHMYIEAESRRIGKIVLPEFLLDAKSKGIHFLIQAPLDLRVERIYEDYITPYEEKEWFLQRINSAFKTIAHRMETSARNACYRYLMEKKYQLFIRTLLKDYYDPRYSYKKEEYQGQFIEINALDITKASQEIMAYGPQKINA